MKIKNKSISSIIIGVVLIIFTILIGSTYFITYSIFKDNLYRANEDLIVETNNQVTYNYEKYIENIIHISDVITSEVSNDNSLNYQNTKDVLDVFLITKPELLSAQIYDFDGNLIVSDESSNQHLNCSNELWFKKAISDDTIHFLTPSLYGGEYKEIINFSKVINLFTARKKAVLKLSIDFKEILNLNYNINLGDKGHLLVIDDNYKVIYQSSNNLNININKELECLKGAIFGLTNYDDGVDNFKVCVSTISNSRWRIALFYNLNKIEHTLNNFILIFSLVDVGIIIFGSLLILFVGRGITNPIRKLEKVMRNVDENNEFIYMENENGPKEVVSLYKSYNKMIEQIQFLMNKVVEEQTNQRKSELKALQNQINPHFLYNTLDSIVWLIDNDYKEDAQNMIIALAKLFRISISRGNSIIPVRDEFEHVRNYLFIQSMRYKESFDYKIEVDEKCYKYKVMKLILQPLVENCIYHGLKNKIDKGHIIIKGYMEENNLIIEISDNGYGIKEEKIAELYERFNNPDLNDGVGLKNVYQRIKLYYRNNSYLKIISEVDVGTTIKISIPVEEI